jgi:hypothetical protein
LPSREENLHQFDMLSEQELSELGFNLAMCQASKPSTSTGTKPPVEISAGIGLVRLALRDTIVRGWLSAVRKSDDEHPYDPSVTAPVYALLKLALILTWDIVA